MTLPHRRKEAALLRADADFSRLVLRLRGEISRAPQKGTPLQEYFVS
jgi:hypothetical protein